ncbi:hypothetical protein pb186bvf_008253 [Paramecium bursaria]
MKLEIWRNYLSIILFTQKLIILYKDFELALQDVRIHAIVINSKQHLLLMQDLQEHKSLTSLIVSNNDCYIMCRTYINYNHRTQNQSRIFNSNFSLISQTLNEYLQALQILLRLFYSYQYV